MAQLGKYELVRKLATGGMAEVFLARMTGPMGFAKTLVVKRILAHLAEDPQFVEMFLGEAKLAALLNHPNIAQIFDFGVVDDTYFIAMEHVDGPNLRVLNRRAFEQGRPIPFALAAKIISYACEGLAFAHEFCDPGTGEPLRLIHRDISPDNLLVSRNGSVKVVDFGIAKAAGQAQHTRTGLLKGKVAYMSPEQIKGGTTIDLRTDVFALGVVLYELLAGGKPFTANSDVSAMHAILHEPIVPLETRRPGVPEGLRRIVEKALEKDRDARYRDCRELQAALDRFVLSEGEPIGQFQLSQLVATLAPLGEASGPSSLSSLPRDQVSVVATGDILVATPRPSQPSPAEAEPTVLEPAPQVLAQPTELRAPEPVAPAQAQPTVLERPKRAGWVLAAAVAIAAMAVGGYLGLRAPSEPPGEPAPSPPSEPAVAVQAEPPVEVEPSPPDAGAALAPAAEEPVPPPRIDPTPNRPLVAEHKPPAANTVPTHRPKPPRPAPPALASFTVETQPPLQVRVNGRFIGRSPVKVTSIPAGEAQVEVYDSTLGISRAQKIAVSPGENPPVRFEFAAGSLEFRIRPFATVILNGRALGQTPLPPEKVYEGKHRVRLVNAELGKDVTVEVEVKAGEPSVLKYNLEK